LSIVLVQTLTLRSWLFFGRWRLMKLLDKKPDKQHNRPPLYGN